MGHVVHWSEGLGGRYDALVAYTDRLEFLLAVAAACAAQEIGDLIHDNVELMSAANIEANEVGRLRSALERIKALPLNTLADALVVQEIADEALQ